MPEEVAVAFYQDWKFWSFAVSFTALVISLVPHAKRLAKAKLEGDFYRHLVVTHKVGNPNAQLFVMLTNSGGKNLRIRSMRLQIKRGDISFNLNGMSYFHQSGDKESLLLTPFRLASGAAEWGHIVVFYSAMSPQELRAFKSIQGNMREDIVAKRAGLSADGPVVEVDAANLKPALAHFDRKFKWEPGEYEVTLQVETDPPNAFQPKQLRMTIFESDSAELKETRDRLKFGFDILIGDAPSVLIELQER